MPLREQAPPDLEGLGIPPEPYEGQDPDFTGPGGWSDDVDDDPEAHTPRVRPVTADEAEARLVELLDKLGWDIRPGQVAMVRHIAENVTARRHALVAAPTGTGKSLALSLPASLAAGRLPVLISTASKALQQQVIETDLPRLALVDPDLDVAVLKGRGEYLCKAKLAESTLQEPLFDSPVDPDAFDALLDWADSTTTGDRAEAPDGVNDAAWRAVAVGPRECPGKRECKFGSVCFAEAAKQRARQADIVMINHHLLLLDALSERKVLPDHDLVMVDEAHKLVDVATSVLGAQVHPKALTDLAAQVGDHATDRLIARLREAAAEFSEAIEPLDPDKLATIGEDSPLYAALEELHRVLNRLVDDLEAAEFKASLVSDGGDDLDKVKRLRAIAEGLAGDIGALMSDDPNLVSFVEVNRRSRSLRIAPIDVAKHLSSLIFSDRTVVGTSATILVDGKLDDTAAKIGMSTSTPWAPLIVPDPFDYPSNAVLYVPRRAPKPSAPGYDDMAYDTTLKLIEAAGGRTLLLFTSYTRMNQTCDWLQGRLPAGVNLLVQGDAPPRRLISEYIDDETSVLAGVATFWEGISAEGLSSVCVVIDKLPFPRRNDPLIDARRNAAANGFAEVDLPHAAVHLAQGVGRLIRTVDDFGIVAVLDQRLANAEYRNILTRSLPDAHRTVNLQAPTPVDPSLLDLAGYATPNDVYGQFPGGIPAIDWLQHRLAQAGR